MIKIYSEIIGTHIKEENSAEVLALLRDLIIDPDTGKVEALWVKPLTLPLSNAIIQIQDILDWKKHVYIKGDQVMADPADIIRIVDILSKNRLILGNRVVGANGKDYGRVYNVDFDSKSYYLKNISCQKSLLGLFGYESRLFPYERILEVLEDRILVDDKSQQEEKIPLKGTSVDPAV